MGHTKPEDLKDVQHVLKEIRTWDDIKEKSPNIFYFKAKPFLHFHDKDGKRWADVLEGADWGKAVDLPFESTKLQYQSFLREVERRYKLLKK
jgi:hypothetical protein